MKNFILNLYKLFLNKRIQKKIYFSDELIEKFREIGRKKTEGAHLKLTGLVYDPKHEFKGQGQIYQCVAIFGNGFVQIDSLTGESMALFRGLDSLQKKLAFENQETYNKNCAFYEKIMKINIKQKLNER